MMGVTVGSLVLTAALPVANVFVMCGLGALLARKGILDGRARQVLSQLVFWIFLPALTFTNLAKSVDLQYLALWWMLPVNMTISIGVGLVVGWIFARILNVDLCFQNHFVCSIAIGNVANLPLVLVTTICTADTPYADALGSECERLGISYIAFGMWIASTFQYCVAYNMLKRPLHQKEEKEAKSIEIVLQRAASQRSATDSEAAENRQAGNGQSLLSKGLNSNNHQPIQPQDERKADSLSPQPPQIEEQSRQQKAESWQQQEEEEEEEEAGALLSSSRMLDRDDDESAMTSAHGKGGREEPNEGSQPLGQKRWTKIQSWLKHVPWSSYLNCPTLAAAAGLTVGCVSILKKLLFGDSPPLLFVTQSLETMAGGMIPAMMLILGGSLAKGPGSSRLPRRVIVGVVLVRLLVIPAIGTCTLMLLLKAGAFRSPDILFTLTLLLVHATPTAMNLQTVATLVQNREEEMSCLLCWQYLSSLLVLPLWMLLFVYLTST